jgi:hypothetical protein
MSCHRRCSIWLMTQTGRPSSITTAWTARFSSSEAGPVPEVEEAEEGGVRSGEHGGRAGVGQPLQPVGVAQPAARRLVAEAGLRAGGGVPDGVITGGAVLSSRVRCVGRKKKKVSWLWLMSRFLRLRPRVVDWLGSEVARCCLATSMT